MNRSQIDDAIKSGKPFTIRTADGKEFFVPSTDHVFVSPKGTFVQVVDDEERINSIPLLTMTSVEYRLATSP
jgi:antirestriction protein ArdC